MALGHHSDGRSLAAIDSGLKSIRTDRTQSRGRRPITGGEEMRAERCIEGRVAVDTADRHKDPSPRGMPQPPRTRILRDSLPMKESRRKIAFLRQSCFRWAAGVATFTGSERFVASEWPLSR
jgi:hypothetical protein